MDYVKNKYGLTEIHIASKNANAIKLYQSLGLIQCYHSIEPYDDKTNEYSIHIHLIKKLNITQNGSNNSNYGIILFPDLFNGYKYHKSLIKYLHKHFNKLILIKIPFNDYSKKSFSLADIDFDIVTENAYNKLDKSIKYLVFGINQGCVFTRIGS